MLDAVKQIQLYTENIDFESFETNAMMQDACIRQLSIMGEAGARLSEELRSANHMLRWKEIIGFRNIVVHQYFGFDIRIVWDIISEDLPGMKVQQNNILSNLRDRE